MNNKKLIAEALLEIAKRSKTTFLEVGKVDKELIDAAKKMGILIPSPDLMVMKTVYCEIDKVNLNRVILSRKAVEEGLPTLIGKNCNWEHGGAGFVAGYTISAKINEDKVETINILFKSLFPEQAEKLKEKVKSGDAAVSFEIWNIDPFTKKSVIKKLEDGTLEITKIIFAGTGVLILNPPACPKAKIFKLIAHREINEAEKITDKIFNEDLVFAQLAVDEPKCLNCKNCKCETQKEDKKLEEIKAEEVKTAEVVAEVIVPAEIKLEAEITPEVVAEVKPEVIPEVIAEIKKEEIIPEIKVEETPVVAEVKPEEVAKTTPQETVVAPEVKPEVVAEVKAPAAVVAEEVKAQEVQTIVPKVIVKVTHISSDIFIETYVDGTMSGTSEGKSSSKSITEYSDGTKDERTSDSEYKKKYDLAELEEKVNAVKAEKDSEIANLKQELEVAKQPKEIVKVKEEDTTPASLTVGEVIATGEDNENKTMAKKVNDIIAKKHNR